jgi:tRNA(fMet)-specific endonuclease VapC
LADYLLDTMIIRYWYDEDCPEHEKVIARVKSILHPDPQTLYVPRLYISVVTLGEIEYGHRVTPTIGASIQAEYLKFVNEQCPEPREITRHVGEHYGTLRAWLFNTFSDKKKRTRAKRPEELVCPTTARELGVQENDVWIAAQAITFNLTLVTHDFRGHFGRLLRHFQSELRLTVEDWTQ